MARRPFEDDFSGLLKSFRQKSNATQLQLAVALGVDHTMISKWERDVFLPTRGQVLAISDHLELSAAERDALNFSWSRAQPGALRGLIESEPKQIVDSILTSINAVRELRNTGAARLAQRLSARDAEAALRQIRSLPWSRQHEQMLYVASELVLENVKANLDYLTKEEVAGQALAEQLSWLRVIEEASSDDRTRFFSMLADEANSYVGGDVGEAFKSSQFLLRQEMEVPITWRLELLRASAINAGKLSEKSAVESADRQINEFLAAHTDNLTSDEHSFLMEGLTRGWAGTDPEKSMQTLELIWQLREQAGADKSVSQLRFVQLVRTHAEAESAYLGGTISRETKSLILSAIEVSKANGYDRYVPQLEAFLA